MPIKKRFLECECGEVFTEIKGGLEGSITFSPWKNEGNRVRATKTDIGGDIVNIEFIRYGKCEKCNGSLMVEKKIYDLSPASSAGEKDHAAISVNREFIMAQGTVSAMAGSSTNLKKESND